MRSDLPLADPRPSEERLRWTWIGGAVLIGAVLISLTIRIVDPGLRQPEVTGLVATLSLILVGMLVGYHSHGETVRETAVSGMALVLLAGGLGASVLELHIAPGVWLLSPFLAAGISMTGGWVGELLQGTLEEAHGDTTLDWPWLFASVVIGFTLSAYAVSLGNSLFELGDMELLFVFATSFLVTGLVVGFFSPGITLIEPAIAALGMIVLHSGLVLLWFEGLPPRAILLGFGAGALLALIGAWFGEGTQRLVEVRQARRAHRLRAPPT